MEAPAPSAARSGRADAGFKELAVVALVEDLENRVLVENQVFLTRLGPAAEPAP